MSRDDSKAIARELKSHTMILGGAIAIMWILEIVDIFFEGEQHGFRRAENIKRAIDGEFYFYSRVFGFETAETLEPVEIDNL